jgi:DNA-binding LytR/AlgR family response regulator
MIKVVIIEDEHLAAQRLGRIVSELPYNLQVIAFLDSVQSSTKWFNEGNNADLAFMDIQLGDGLSFDIFTAAKVECPVIFTTAFDEYSLKAFKVNSIDYLLKPIDEQEVDTAVKKFLSIKNREDYSHNLAGLLKTLTQKYKERFVIKVGEKIKTVETADVLYFFSMGKATFLHTNENREYDIEQTLEQLEEMVSPLLFFRINRKYIVQINSIKDIISWTNSRLKITLKGCDDDDIFVSRERVKSFKDWLDT